MSLSNSPSATLADLGSSGTVLAFPLSPFWVAVYFILGAVSLVVSGSTIALIPIWLGGRIIDSIVIRPCYFGSIRTSYVRIDPNYWVGIDPNFIVRISKTIQLIDIVVNINTSGWCCLIITKYYFVAIYTITLHYAYKETSETSPSIRSCWW